ncbi:hypothetical protein C1645_878633 [Glomus cerebriforme]|uniref:Uncharacterized protein n=1 Tax=Glomus cerebriforme TaxID=658196 RepID=A0A397SPH8_9GLOM|nr:hypothetical protein C1645_878633 [Glomus cerebriforme]
MSKRCLIVTTVITLAIFFGIFFGVDYFEVKRSQYIPTICLSLSANIVPRFCCDLDCNSCSEASSGVPKCKLLVSQSQSLSPEMCRQNSTFCPKSGSDADCDDGPYCCGECCTGTGNSEVCSCCDNVSHHACQMSCAICYNVGLNVEYYVDQQLQHSKYTQDFKKSLKNANKFLTEHMPNSLFWCYYNPSSVTEVILESIYKLNIAQLY